MNLQAVSRGRTPKTGKEVDPDDIVEHDVCDVASDKKTDNLNSELCNGVRLSNESTLLFEIFLAVGQKSLNVTLLRVRDQASILKQWKSTG